MGWYSNIKSNATNEFRGRLFFEVRVRSSILGRDGRTALSGF